MKLATFGPLISSAACAAGLDCNPLPPNPALNMQYGDMNFDPLSCNNLAREKFAITAYPPGMEEVEDEFGSVQDTRFQPGPLFFVSVGHIVGSWVPWPASTRTSPPAAFARALLR